MSISEGYGVVYTPTQLSEFVAKILIDEYICNKAQIKPEKSSITIVDPACGEASLLTAINKVILKKISAAQVNLIGVDIDSEAIKRDQHLFKNNFSYQFINLDAILPDKNADAHSYWEKIIPEISLIIANPPWSSEKIYQKSDLNDAGYVFYNGQYDSYILFIELCLKVVSDNGYCAFIIPDSIFSGENKAIRKYLSEQTELCIIARLGEKLFTNVNRATSVIVVKKSKPTENSKTKCFRLNTDQRKKYLAGELDLYNIYIQSAHKVTQSRFNSNASYIFDIDTRQDEEQLLRKIELQKINWTNLFHYGRGVEISKNGMIVTCPQCGVSQGFSKRQADQKEKACHKCGTTILIGIDTIDKIIEDSAVPSYTKIFVGENVRRYSIVGEKHIKMNVEGINYKSPQLYAPPKILIRKTGLGINACIDYTSTYISQTVYSCNFINMNNSEPLEYYLGVLNSRLIFYYYLKVYGENEWKSHPYITKDIIFTLPIKAIDNNNEKICLKIVKIVKKLLKSYSRELDMNLENLVAQLYGISEKEQEMIQQEINTLPDLSSINNMKY